MSQDEKQNRRSIEIAGDLSRILTKIDRIENDIKEIKISLENNYVTQDQFAPVKNIVFGMVSIVLVGVLGALITLIIQK